MRAWISKLMVGLLLATMLAGCSSDDISDELETFDLTCEGKVNGPSLEATYLGTCWGAIGHHTYVLPEARMLHGIAGDITANHAERASTVPAPLLSVAASVDGITWTNVTWLRYPANHLELERHQFEFSWEGRPVPAYFVRISMPLSNVEGLAGFLDRTQLRLTLGEPVNIPETPRPMSFHCDAQILEDFFSNHPCWFGGYHNEREPAPIDPAQFEEGYAGTNPRDWNAPSFFHTYYHAQDMGGNISVAASARQWRAWNQARCNAHLETSPEELTRATTARIVLQSSPDGVTWQPLGELQGQYFQVLEAAGLQVPQGTHFLRFIGGPPPASFQGHCHHPGAHLTHSSWHYE